jgi:hypothetical protein
VLQAGMDAEPKGCAFWFFGVCADAQTPGPRRLLLQADRMSAVTISWGLPDKFTRRIFMPFFRIRMQNHGLYGNRFEFLYRKNSKFILIGQPPSSQNGMDAIL